MRLCISAIVIIVTLLQALHVEDPPNLPPFIVHQPLAAGVGVPDAPVEPPPTPQPPSTQPSATQPAAIHAQAVRR